MIRLLFRILGCIVLIAAFAALIMDGAKTLAAEALTLTPLGQTWTEYAAVSLNQFQFALQEHLGLIWFWDNVMLWVLNQPTFAVLGILGIFIYLIGRKPAYRGY